MGARVITEPVPVVDGYRPLHTAPDHPRGLRLRPISPEIRTAARRMTRARNVQAEALHKARAATWELKPDWYYVTAHERPIVEALIALLRWLREPPTGEGRVRRFTAREVWDALAKGRERWVAFRRDPDFGAPLVMPKGPIKNLARMLKRRRDPGSEWILSEDGYVLTITLANGRGRYRLKLRRFDPAADKGEITFALARSPETC